MTTTLHLVCLFVGAAFLALRTGALVRNPRDVANSAFCVYVGFSALGYLVLLPPVYVLIDRTTGVPNSAGMVSAVCVLGLTGAQQVLMSHWTYPAERAKRQGTVRALLAGGMVLAFVTTFFLFIPRVQKFDDFYVEYTHQLSQAPYLVIYAVACIAGQVDVARNCARFARIADRSWLRTGMVITTVGACVILVYGAIRVADITAGQLGGDLRFLEPTAWLCGDIGSALALIGWAVPTVGPRLTQLGEWFGVYRAHVVLYPLWKALYDAVPEVSLDPPKSRLRDLLRVRDMDFWLHRRVVEIQDARRAIRAEVDSATAQLVGDEVVSGDGLPAAIAAAQLRVAQDGGSERTDLAGEVEWLTAMTHRFVLYQRSSG